MADYCKRVFIAAIAMTYLITPELFPTTCRSTASSLAMLPGRFIAVAYRKSLPLISAGMHFDIFPFIFQL